MLRAVPFRSASILALLVASALGVSAGRPAAAQDSPEGKALQYPQTFTATLDEPATKALAVAKPQRPLPSKRLGTPLSSAMIPQIALDPVDRDALLAEDAQKSLRGEAKALRFGVGRPVALRAVDGSWYEVDGGSLWVAEVVSPEALGMRLRFAGVSLPAGAELAVYGVENDGPAMLRPVFKSGAAVPRVERYDAAGLAAKGRDTFWTATLPGERARIELFLPAAEVAAGRRLPFTLDRLQHIYLDPAAGQTKAAGPCHNDVSCHPEWEAVARAVGGVGVINGDFLYCSGQLLNTQRTDFTPYFLTANHCLESAGEAADTEIYWFYQTATCGGTPPRVADVPSSAGATLVSTQRPSDYTLLMIEGTLPAEVAWAGWVSAPVRNGVASTAIHHPDGDYKRISFGDKADSAACGTRDMVRVNWTDAPTEPGSSGSGVFRNDTKQLFGQLSFGPSACGNETYDCYGAFSSTFTRVRAQLREGADDPREPSDTCGRPRILRAGSTDNVVKVNDPDWYRISVPAGRTLRVELEFEHANGDVDARVHGACNAAPLAVSDGTGNTEVLTVPNNGRRAVNYTWQVYLASDTRNNYTMRVSIE